MTAFVSHCSLSYHESGPNELETFAHSISTGIYGNSGTFASPPVATKTAFDAVVETYHEKYEAYKNGGKDQKGAYSTARTALIAQLDTTAVYVDELPGVNDDMIQLAGYVPTKKGESQAVTPAVPSVIKITRGVTTQLLPECAAVAGATFYGCICVAGQPLPAGLTMNANGQLVVAPDNSNPNPPAPPKGVVLIIDVNKARKKKFIDLTKGVDYYFYFYAGNSAGVSALSEVQVLMCG